MHILVFITAADRHEARRIAQTLLKKKLVACVNITGPVESFFWWKRKVDRAREVMLIAKTKKGKFPAVARAVRSAHSYEVPEIIAVPVCAGYAPYLEWIDGSLG